MIQYYRLRDCTYWHDELINDLLKEMYSLVIKSVLIINLIIIIIIICSSDDDVWCFTGTFVHKVG